MKTITIDDELYRKIESRARQQGISTQDEADKLLALAFGHVESVETFKRKAEEMRKQMGPTKSNSAEFIRELRDTR